MDYELDVDLALAAAVLEVEKHVASAGWDQPARLYALVDTAHIVETQPELAAQLGLDSPRERGSLTPIEQDELPEGMELEEALLSIAWPEVIIGCVAVVERLVLPPAAEGDVPEDPYAAQEFAREHPDAQDVRIVAGAVRSGATYCALRTRSNDDDSSVMGGVDIVPGLLELVRGTLQDDEIVEDETVGGDDE
ncbi:hypothetical protein JK386_16710 [Nocardioides sp. zg-536]|uniref:Uncharacterized protein n=1 Tax=Nocardioides faecalis TaxID=2803858 RepID=A0A939BZQ3_9ACTN|nr:PPA1309 family protein [Nocardioides faecalis]MBM9461548.1 hypothetical protein [Nocardioides faecalis]QVI57827.1 hypothetical protein KG111_12255 [Nocardioides faecalis]